MQKLSNTKDELKKKVLLIKKSVYKRWEWKPEKEQPMMNNTHPPFNSPILTPYCQGRGNGRGGRGWYRIPLSPFPADLNFVGKIHRYSNLSANYRICIFIRLENIVSFSRLSKSQQTLIKPFSPQSPLLTLAFYCIASISYFHEA